MKKFILRLRSHFLTLLKRSNHHPNTCERPVFNIQEKIQKKIKTITKKPAVKMPPIPMAQVTIQTISIPMIDPAVFKKNIEESLEKPMIEQSQRKPNIIRKPLSEKDIHNISNVLKSFHGTDVRDLF